MTDVALIILGFLHIELSSAWPCLESIQDRNYLRCFTISFIVIACPFNPWWQQAVKNTRGGVPLTNERLLAAIFAWLSVEPSYIGRNRRDQSSMH